MNKNLLLPISGLLLIFAFARVLVLRDNSEAVQLNL